MELTPRKETMYNVSDFLLISSSNVLNLIKCKNISQLHCSQLFQTKGKHDTAVHSSFVLKSWTLHLLANKWFWHSHPPPQPHYNIALYPANLLTIHVFQHCYRYTQLVDITNQLIVKSFEYTLFS